MSRASISLFALIIGLAAAACGDDGNGPEAGLDLYSGAASARLGDPSNEAKCATCHSNDGSIAGQPGVSLKDIAFRTSYKGGDAPDLLAATNACVTGWMGGAALKEADDSWKKLEAYLVSISDAAMTTPNTLAPEVLDNEAAYEAAYAGGDAGAGAAKYTANCSRCHDGALKVGARGATARSAIKPLAIGRIAQKVRTSGPPPSGMQDSSDLTPGPMPFFEPEELPAQDLKDIIAYLRQ